MELNRMLFSISFLTESQASLKSYAANVLPHVIFSIFQMRKNQISSWCKDEPRNFEYICKIADYSGALRRHVEPGRTPEPTKSSTLWQQTACAEARHWTKSCKLLLSYSPAPTLIYHRQSERGLCLHVHPNNTACLLPLLGYFTDNLNAVSVLTFILTTLHVSCPYSGYFTDNLNAVCVSHRSS